MCLDSITVVMLSRHCHETLHNRESLDKKQNKARINQEENQIILSWGIESDKDSYFNQQSESQATSASSLDVSAVSRKK